MHQSQATLIDGLPEDAGEISRFSFQQYRKALGPLLGHAHAWAKNTKRSRYLLGAVEDRSGHCNGAFDQFVMTYSESFDADIFDLVQQVRQILIGIDQITPKLIWGELHLRKNCSTTCAEDEFLSVTDATSKTERLGAFHFRHADAIGAIRNKQRYGFRCFFPETAKYGHRKVSDAVVAQPNVSELCDGPSQMEALWLA
ncbi:hypothetical protein WL88_25930 [Burkholderia diffusa]|uniref:Uncharacterized protein n=1 Tax=Burkholderia diffusa TaxID=488732 RepID=A0AAW3P9X0_9BURK|nr:hypothetical protein WL86_29975 [Burkholderia diffusa]KWF38706.1 hypothetical protein WL85_11115 [Burkholderia diffusa]KWF46751.1 hypothetical protein WL88_25930 [Burkholderia diffusa]KWF50679.1 hypothetical protein WL87_15990 [Burkholderia diffusa]